MGMSSSQARLLNLTTRMHQIEYRAAKIEAEKLQLANKSRQVYLEYQNAMEQTKIQGKTLNQDASIGFVDLNLRVLEDSYSYGLAKTLHLQDINSGKLFITKQMAAKYNLDGSGVVGSEYEFVTNAGLNGTIAGFSAVTNSAPSATYTGVPTEVELEAERVIPVVDSGVGFQEVSPFDRISVEGANRVSDITSFTQGETYIITNQEDLMALYKLVNINNPPKSTKGVNFVLTKNIEWDNEEAINAGIRTWNGIGTNGNQFQGIFDGNGFTINGLTGSKGLFGYVSGDASYNETTGATATYGIVKNIKLTNLNITGTTQMTGGLIGQNTRGLVENVSVQGDVKTATNISATNASWVGGLIGNNQFGIVNNATGNVDVNSVKGNCIGGLIGHDTGGRITNCRSTGTVKGTQHVGGLIGHEYRAGGGVIESCVSYPTHVVATSKPRTAGAFIGSLTDGGTGNVNNSTYITYETIPAVGNGTAGQTGNQELSPGTTLTYSTTNVYLPSVESIKSNIYKAIEKAGKNDDLSNNFGQNLNRWINDLYKVDSNFSNVLVEDALKLASINDYLVDYLENGNNADIAELLINDIESFSLSSTSKYQDKYVPTAQYEYTAYKNGNTDTAKTIQSITTGSLDNIAGNLYNAFRNAGCEVSDTADITNIKQWLENHTNTANGGIELAELNNYITSDRIDNSIIQNIYNAYTAGETYTLPNELKTYSADIYDVSFSNQEQSVVWANMTPELEEALDFYDLIKDGYIIVEDEQAKDKEWFVNMINFGAAILIEKDHIKKEKYETTVATNTSLQEVADETKLRKAEAKYEADMRRIDMKDRKYDYDLAAIENERNAIKQEIETLKTVAKDNVERTFKLFG